MKAIFVSWCFTASPAPLQRCLGTGVGIGTVDTYPSNGICLWEMAYGGYWNGVADSHLSVLLHAQLFWGHFC